MVVDDPVDQQDRRLRRIDVVVDQPALLRAEPVQVMPPNVDPRCWYHGPIGYRHQMGGHPSGLHEDAGCHAGEIAGQQAAHRPGCAALHSPILRGGKLADVTAEEQVAAEPADSGRLRIIVAKPGLDGHDRGAKVVARALRDAGMEVIYTGLHQTPEQIVQTALAEDADAIGLSVLSGAHMTLFAKVVDLLEQADADDIVVFGGGIIPEADREPLAAMGVAQVFTPGATMSEIVAWVRANVHRHSALD